MSTIGNVLWLIFGGILMGIAAYLIAVICFISIIFIPVGLQFMKLGKFLFWPMGKEVVSTNASGIKTIINIIWAILFGWEIAIGFIAQGLLLCISIIGIPFGIQYFKLSIFTLLPLGNNFKKA